MAKAQANIRIGVNEQPAIAGLKRVESAFGKFGGAAGKVAKGVGAVGAAVVAATAAVSTLSVRALAAADDIGKFAERVGLTASQLEQLRFAAEQSGAEFSVMEKGLEALSSRASRMPQNFERWGVSIHDTNGEIADTMTLLERVSDRIAMATTQSERNAIAQDLMSQSSRQLLGLLQQGSEGIRAYSREAEQLGIVITDLEAERAAALSDRFNILDRQFKAIQRTIGSALAPTVLRLTEQVADLATGLREWLLDNREEFEAALANMADLALGVAVRGVQLIEWMDALRESVAQLTQAMVRLGDSVTAGGVSTVLRLLQSRSESTEDSYLVRQLKEARTQLRRLREEGSTGSFGVLAEPPLVDPTRMNFRVDRNLRPPRAAAGGAGGPRSRRSFSTADTDPLFAPGSPDRTRQISAAQRGVTQSPEVRIVSRTEASVDEVGGLLERAESRLQTFGDRVTDWSSMLAGSVTRAFEGVGSAVAGALANAFEGADQQFEAVLGNILKSLGQMLFATGLSATALGALSFIPGLQLVTGGPGAALAGGAAAMALGTALMVSGAALTPGDGIGSNLPSTSRGAVGGGRPRGNGFRRPSDERLPFGSGAGETRIFNVNIGETFENPQRMRRKIREALPA